MLIRPLPPLTGPPPPLPLLPRPPLPPLPVFLFCLMISSKDISTFSIFAAILFRYWWPRACSSDAMKKIMGLHCCLVCMTLCGRSGDIYVRLGLLFRAHYVFFCSLHFSFELFGMAASLSFLFSSKVTSNLPAGSQSLRPFLCSACTLALFEFLF